MLLPERSKCRSYIFFLLMALRMSISSCSSSWQFLSLSLFKLGKSEISRQVAGDEFGRRVIRLNSLICCSSFWLIFKRVLASTSSSLCMLYRPSGCKGGTVDLEVDSTNSDSICNTRLALRLNENSFSFVRSRCCFKLLILSSATFSKSNRKSP